MNEILLYGVYFSILDYMADKGFAGALGKNSDWLMPKPLKLWYYDVNKRLLLHTIAVGVS